MPKSKSCFKKGNLRIIHPMVFDLTRDTAKPMTIKANSVNLGLYILGCYAPTIPLGKNMRICLNMSGKTTNYDISFKPTWSI